MDSNVTRRITVAIGTTPIACSVSAADLVESAATGAQVSAPSIYLLGLSVLMIAALLLRPAVQPTLRWMRNRLSKRRLAARLKASGAPCLSDFILPGACGGLVRIDHAVLAGGGIACVVHKQYGGTVFGTLDEPQWTCVSGGNRKRFMNPVRNSQLRVDAIRKALPGVPVIALVVFDDGARFPSQRPEGVITARELAATLDACRFPDSDIADWDAAWLSLRATAMTDEESRKDLEAQLSFG